MAIARRQASVELPKGVTDVEGRHARGEGAKGQLAQAPPNVVTVEGTAVKVVPTMAARWLALPGLARALINGMVQGARWLHEDAPARRHGLRRGTAQS
jgi:ribosomal protein L6P/L9E